MVKRKLIKEIKQFTKLTESEIELNELIAGAFTEQEQINLIPTLRVTVERDLFHVLAIKKIEKKMIKQVKGESDD